LTLVVDANVALAACTVDDGFGPQPVTAETACGGLVA